MVSFYYRLIGPKDADGMANGVDPDQQSDLGLHCLPRPVCPKTYEHYVTLYSVSSHIEVAKQVQSNGLDNLFRSSSLSRII